MTKTEQAVKTADPLAEPELTPEEQAELEAIEVRADMTGDLRGAMRRVPPPEFAFGWFPWRDSTMMEAACQYIPVTQNSRSDIKRAAGLRPGAKHVEYGDSVLHYTRKENVDKYHAKNLERARLAERSVAADPGVTGKGEIDRGGKRETFSIGQVTTTRGVKDG